MRLGWFYLHLPETEGLGLGSADVGLDPGSTGRDAAGATSVLLRAAGVTDVVPSYENVFVEFDRNVTNEELLRELLDSSAADGTTVAPQEQRTVTIPTVYGGRHGPDLAEVAAVAGLSEEAVVDLHGSVDYQVVAMGFMPGFAFMTGVPDALRLPRRPVPRPTVPAHSVAVANHQAGVYPVESPGGWNLLGRALVPMYDPRRDEPFLVRPGDRVRFSRVEGEVEPPASPAAFELLPSDPSLPTLRVLEPGLLDLIVDRGRLRVGRFGLARGGPLDASTAWLANRLLGNPASAPLLELTLTGPVMEALRPTVVAVTGDALVPLVDGRRREGWSSLPLGTGQVLSFEPGASGCRSYLALSGGIESGAFAGSASTDVRGLVGRPLRAGDVVGAATERSAVAGRGFRPHSREAAEVRVRITPGPQASAEALTALTAGTYVASRGDRTGIALAGPPVPGGEVVSEGVPLGAVQVTSGGSPIVLLHDRGTLGGYHKPAVVHPDDLGVVAQVRPNQRLRFVLTTDDRTTASSTVRPAPRRAR